MSKTILRDYQKRVLREVSGNFQLNRRVLLQMPTGSGKTKTAAYIVKKFASTGRTVLWLVHRDELLAQASRVFYDEELRHRLICSHTTARAIAAKYNNSFLGDDAKIVISTSQTLIRRIGKIEINPDLIIADEAHLSLNSANRKIIASFPNSKLLGLTATPERTDGQNFSDIYDEIVLGPQIYSLIHSGSLARYKIFKPPVNFNPVGVGIKGGDYDPKALEKELDSPVVFGDVLGHYRALCDGMPAIGFCPTVDVARRFASEFLAAGYRAMALDAETDGETRRDALAKLASGGIDVIFSVGILIEGTDVPLATVALWLRRTTSTAIWLQGNGRVLRPHPAKEFAYILDFVGNSSKHGMPCKHRDWALDGKKKTKREMPSGDDDVSITTCTQCFAVYLSDEKECPRCGHIEEKKQRKDYKKKDGALEEVTSEELEAQRWARKKEERQCVTLADFERIEKERGYKRGWAYMRYKKRKVGR